MRGQKQKKSIKHYFVSPYSSANYFLDSFDITFIIKRKISNSYFSLMSGLSSLTFYNYLTYATNNNESLIKHLGLSLIGFPIFYIGYKKILINKSFFKKSLALGFIVGLTICVFYLKN